MMFLWSFQAFNVLRYEIGQRYQSHYDAFDPAQYGPQKSQRVSMNKIFSGAIFSKLLAIFPVSQLKSYTRGHCGL